MKIHVKLPNGATREAASKLSHTVMAVIRDAGLPIRADCGGAMACASCHVVVDDAWMARVGKPGPEESDLLDSSDYRVPNSRLACQIAADDALDGLCVTLQLDAFEG